MSRGIVDAALLLVDAPADSRGVYTPMNRGREANYADVVIQDNESGRDLPGVAVTRD